jgi:hypothetical protein
LHMGSYCLQCIHDAKIHSCRHMEIHVWCCHPCFMLLICFSLRSCVVLFVVDQSFHVKMIIGFSILLTLFWKQISILLVAMSTLNYVVFICSNHVISQHVGQLWGRIEGFCA